MYYFYVYGFKSDDILMTKSLLENRLDIVLEEKDSEYFGVTYSFKNDLDEKLMLQENYDGEGFLEPNHESFQLIFSVTIKGQGESERVRKEILSTEGSVLIKNRKLSI